MENNPNQPVEPISDTASPRPVQPVPENLPPIPDTEPTSYPQVQIPPPPPAKTSQLRSILSTILILLAAPAIALLIINFIFQPYQVDGPSMQTTLYNNDRLIVWKMGRTWSRITNHQYIPNRGDVIIFIKRGFYESNGKTEKQLIKRVIGLPGEHVVVQNGEVTIFNSQYPEGFNPDRAYPYGDVIQVTEHNVDVIVPAGHVFVMGDNRGNSEDSRAFGPIPASDIVGKLVARILPLKDAERF